MLRLQGTKSYKYPSAKQSRTVVIITMDLLSSLVYSLLVVLPLLYCCYYYSYTHHRLSSDVKVLPVSSHWLLGLLPDYINNRHRYLDWVTDLLASHPTPTLVFHIPGQDSGVVTADPVVVEYVLKTNFGNYPKGEDTISSSLDFLGHGIFNSDGELWRSQRKAASFEFNRRSLRNFVGETVWFEITRRLLPLLGRAAQEKKTVDLQEVLERFAFDNICRVAFGVDPASLAEEGDRETPPGFMKAFDDAVKSLTERFYEPITAIWRIKKLLGVGSERILRESTKIVHDFATNIVRSRRANSGGEHDDLLSRFISGGSDCTDEFLRDVIVNFMLAGRDTTSSALTWFFWLLSSHPEVEGKILAEIRSVKAVRKNPQSEEGDTICFSFDELREMNYLHAAITESLRLYPPVPADNVTCKEDDVLPGGTSVGKGWYMLYSAYSMGRMEGIWGKDCREYRPERWLVDGVFRPENPFKFPVFHAGPRICLGKEMAYVQMKSIAASVVERFETQVVGREEKEIPGFVLSLTLRMEGGLQVRVKERAAIQTI